MQETAQNYNSTLDQLSHLSVVLHIIALHHSHFLRKQRQRVIIHLDLLPIERLQSQRLRRTRRLQH